MREYRQSKARKYAREAAEANRGAKPLSQMQRQNVEHRLFDILSRRQPTRG
jgi:hypothetical protein